MARFTDKVVLVTGALGGIGSATARRFAAEGALLALTDIGKTADDVPAALVARLPWPTGWAFWPADLSKPADVDTLFTEVLEALRAAGRAGERGRLRPRQRRAAGETHPRTAAQEPGHEPGELPALLPVGGDA